MVRGTNKMIIEVVETDNQFFEKAILFVKATQADQSQKYLDSQAKEYVATLQAPARIKRPTKAKWIRLAKIGGGVVLAVALLAWIVFQGL